MGNVISVMKYKGHTLEVWHDDLSEEHGWVARIDGHDEPLMYASTRREAVKHGKQLINLKWF